MNTNSYEAVLQALQERLDGTVMSKFARHDDCTLYREAVEHCMGIVRQVRDAHQPESGLQWKEVEGYEGVLQESGKVGVQKVWPGDAVFCINDFKFYVLTLPSLPDATQCSSSGDVHGT